MIFKTILTGQLFEIRGFNVPEPATLTLLCTAAALAFRRTKRT